jgi:hypothetical protein
MKHSDICEAAKQVLIKRGWCQGTSSNGRGFCCLGALAIAGSSFNDDIIKSKLRAFIGEPISTWNDRPTTNLGNILAGLDVIKQDLFSEGD